MTRRKALVPRDLNPFLASTFKYKKRTGNTSEIDRVVCLTDFEDDECVRQLPRCKHSFHAPCIDLWLYSHSDCPLCRTPVDRLSKQIILFAVPNHSGLHMQASLK
ncbi:hypothetical protein CIPAW_01G220400 [Carya illinoinensis]|uniref:RING-type E3 ubiquitin transferase n=1 Tax=Carya illinoinensis TaxID=32201 RepID=A0A8T1RQU9_CARIL|nr:hypothetical protein CIPAW_01G220400 [Carya illinoinensis]KAG6733328.1 hypothetical protein I3842_01G221200 [Carya illinoinensis]